jgi:hypothetical protein
MKANIARAIRPMLTAASVMKESFHAYIGTKIKNNTVQKAARALNQWRAR